MHDAFFKKMYGDCRKGGVTDKLEAVTWLPRHGGGTVRVTSVNGVAEKLRRISNELDQLPDELIKYLLPMGGGFNCRNIAHVDRSSAHSYGIAIDINPKFGDYWQWHKAGAGGIYEHRNGIISIVCTSNIAPSFSLPVVPSRCRRLSQ